MTIVIGFDPGYSGGICILKDSDTPQLFSMPVIKTKKGTAYDVLAIYDILYPYRHFKVKTVIEDVHTMPGQGVSSQGKMMEGKGILIGLCAGVFGQMPTMVSPPTWKRKFPELTDTPELIALKAEAETLKSASAKARYKAAVKENTRKCVAKRYPKLADAVKLVKDDGKADACFIAMYCR